MVVEDVHFADDATIELLGFLARRLAAVRAVLVVTYRDDEIGPAHPLQVFLGVTAGLAAERIELAPLSRPRRSPTSAWPVASTTPQRCTGSSVGTRSS
ncbi:MAG: hypothetical protein WKH47_07765 [Actinomycetes bacterium]